RSVMFMFQQEDVIRDSSVTGVQTCALLFSSRRRHTRFKCDWSSDVCSSDLICAPAEAMDYHYKNAMGDECIFVHHGAGTVSTTFGTLKFHAKDYILIPKGVIYGVDFDKPAASRTGEPNRFIVIETANGSHIGPPPRYISKKTSQFLEHAPYCERDLRLPQLPLTYDESGKFDVRIKARDSVHSYIYEYHPLDVVGWDGCYYP